MTSKKCLKGDYKVHVTSPSNVADHCVLFALSDRHLLARFCRLPSCERGTPVAVLSAHSVVVQSRQCYSG
ncbi:hypothetical protein pdam_00024657 [Pocillopora damicornis]|uniref:Uncharacterized protein n=1 Tax=Pocillopora damicornis TaxID=46731 RepID=A0A3M6U7F4_POCDA|nr:hypothetical protein pdam_00024657 [Pocillopora damicornis]